MILPYRTRRFFRGLGIAALILALILVLVWIIWMVWLDRYVVYTRDGAVLDFDLPPQVASGEVALPPEDDFTVSIYYNEGDNTISLSTELTQVAGYYISAQMLEQEMDLVMAQLRKLPAGTPVMVEMKDIQGRFFFDTTLGPVRSTIDADAMNELLNFLRLSEFYTIAKFPALRDYYYGLDHVSDGIFLKSGMGLWMDDDRCYWLNPNSQNTQSYIIQTITELKLMGFDEVVLGDFSVPRSDGLKFNYDRNESLSAAAKNIIDACGTDRFAISFCIAETGFILPEGRARVYMENAPASETGALAEAMSFTDASVRLVFITDLNDTRFDAYGVLRPLTTAQLDEEK